MLVASWFYEPPNLDNATSPPGAIHVVFGKTTTDAVSLDDVRRGLTGIYIGGANSKDGLAEVAAAGDVNRDGLADLIVSALGEDSGVAPWSGMVYVIYGVPGPATIDVRDIAARDGGYAFGGSTYGEGAGLSVSTAGDANGDGINDLLIGAFPTSNGRAYVVFLPPAETL